MKLVVLMTMIQQARGQEGPTEEDGWRLDVLVLVYTLGGGCFDLVCSMDLVPEEWQRWDTEFFAGVLRGR